MDDKIKKIHDLQEKWSKISDGISNTISTTASSIDSIKLPLAKRVMARTVALGASEEEMNSVKSRVKSENRDGKIESLIKGEKYTEKKLEDDEEYKELSKKGLIEVKPMSAPNVGMLYMDMVYDKKKDKK